MRCRPTKSTWWPRKWAARAANGALIRAPHAVIDKTVGGSIPKEFIAPIDAGIREAMENGILAGYEMVDIAVLLLDGSYHDVDSSEMAFKIAARWHLRQPAPRLIRYCSNRS